MAASCTLTKAAACVSTHSALSDKCLVRVPLRQACLLLATLLYLYQVTLARTSRCAPLLLRRLDSHIRQGRVQVRTLIGERCVKRVASQHYLISYVTGVLVLMCQWKAFV